MELKLERRVIIGIIYIVSNEKYINYFKKGFLKYVPGLLLPKLNPRIIDDILIEENIIGKIAGINLKPIDLEDEHQLKEYLNAIIKLKDENSTKLFIEEYENLSKKVISQIEEFTNMKVTNGEETRITNIPLVMNDICHILKENLEDKEILIICDNKEKSKRIIKEISKGVKFVTTIGCEKDNDEIYESILEETGISLFFPSNIDRVLENYDMIINLVDNLELNLSKIRKNCILFDFGRGNDLDSSKRPPSISDFAFNLKDLGINGNQFIGNKITSDLYEALVENRNRGINYLYAGGNYYSIKDYVSSFIKVKVKGKI